MQESLYTYVVYLVFKINDPILMSTEVAYSLYDFELIHNICRFLVEYPVLRSQNMEKGCSCCRAASCNVLHCLRRVERCLIVHWWWNTIKKRSWTQHQLLPRNTITSLTVYQKKMKRKKPTRKRRKIEMMIRLWRKVSPWKLFSNNEESYIYLRKFYCSMRTHKLIGSIVRWFRIIENIL